MVGQNDDDSDEPGRMSVRRSLIIWVAGAVLGWVVAVATVYSTLRYNNSDGSLTAKHTDPAAEAAKIAPAAGGQNQNR